MHGAGWCAAASPLGAYLDRVRALNNPALISRTPQNLLLIRLRRVPFPSWGDHRETFHHQSCESLGRAQRLPARRLPRQLVIGVHKKAPEQGEEIAHAPAGHIRKSERMPLWKPPAQAG